MFYTCVPCNFLFAFCLIVCNYFIEGNINKNLVWILKLLNVYVSDSSCSVCSMRNIKHVQGRKKAEHVLCVPQMKQKVHNVQGVIWQGENVFRVWTCFMCFRRKKLITVQGFLPEHVQIRKNMGTRLCVLKL